MAPVNGSLYQRQDGPDANHTLYVYFNNVGYPVSVNGITTITTRTLYEPLLDDSYNELKDDSGEVMFETYTVVTSAS